uniref:Transcriptional regulator, MerR family n=1 Tax=uncultured organism TaxID=155900 RepID=M1P294_9ZZZZ|nr:transcriptional regulator, MerR family [uncultured organism]
MGNKNISMKVVKEKTGLTSRQIRYYDKMNLVFPERSSGNQRLFSEEDIKRLKKIKSLIDRGYTISAVKEKLKLPHFMKKQGKKSALKKIKTDGDRRLTSLYPVSDRSFLAKLLDKNIKKE